MVMLAFSAVTQFPTNGSSTRGAGESAQASTSVEHVMTVETRKILISSPNPGTLACSLTDSRADVCAGPHAGRTVHSAWMKAVFVSPKLPSPTRDSAIMVKPVCHGVENYA